MAEAPIAFWQGNLLSDERRTLAEVRNAKLLGWIVEFPDSGGLVDAGNEDDVLAGSEGHDRFADARSFASDVARSRGYRIVARRRGIEAFAAANPDLVHRPEDDGNELGAFAP